MSKRFIESDTFASLIPKIDKKAKKEEKNLEDLLVRK